MLNSSCNCLRNDDIETERRDNTALQGHTPCTKSCIEKEDCLKNCLAGPMTSIPQNSLLSCLAFPHCKMHGLKYISYFIFSFE